MAILQSNLVLNGCLLADPVAPIRNGMHSCLLADPVAPIRNGMHSTPRICAAVKQGSEQTETREDEVMKMIKNSSGKGRSNWWSPLFNFSTDSDSAWSQTYSEDKSAAVRPVLEQKKEMHVSDFPSKHAKPVANFTKEKARVLRQKMSQLETWHDTMYHSAIAARLAVEQKRVM